MHTAAIGHRQAEVDVLRLQLERGVRDLRAVVAVTRHAAALRGGAENLIRQGTIDMQHIVLQPNSVYLRALRGVEMPLEQRVGNAAIFEPFRLDHGERTEGIPHAAMRIAAVVVVVGAQHENTFVLVQEIVVDLTVVLVVAVDEAAEIADLHGVHALIL